MKKLAIAFVLVLALVAVCVAQQIDATQIKGIFVHLYAKYFEGVRFANEFNAADINAGINAAGADCSWACKVVVPAGSYTTATSAVIPVMLGGAFELACDDAAISYTGSSYAINTNETTGNPFGSNISIHGCRIAGTSAGLGGIHLLPTQGYYVWGNVVTGFSTGDGLALEGAIKSHIYSNQFSSNSNNFHLFSTKCLTSTPFTCAPAQAGTTLPYAPNANVITANILSNSVTRAMLIENSTNAALANVITGNTFETNPTGLEIQGAVGTQVLGNYFENNTTHNLLLNNGAKATHINGNWITPFSNTTWYSIELVSATFTTIENNSEGGTASTCSVNTSVTANSIYIGKNNWFSTFPTCVSGASAIPTGLQGFDGNGAWRASGGLIGNGYQVGFDSGPSKMLIQGTTSGGEITDNPLTTTLLTWTNAGAFSFGQTVGVTGLTTLSGGLKVGASGTTVNTILTGSGTLTYTAITNGTAQSQTLTISGAAVNNRGVSCAPQAGLGSGLYAWNFYVLSANTVTVSIANIGAAPTTPTAVTWGCSVTQ